MTSIEGFTQERFDEILKPKGYQLSVKGDFGGHVYPDVSKVSPKYPWSFHMRRGPIAKGENVIGNYPLPCAYWSKKDSRLDLIHEDKAEIFPYHEEIRGLISSGKEA